MKRSLNIKKDESLSDWCKRLCDHMHVPEDGEWREILRKVCVQSYIKGSLDCQDVLREHGRL